MWKMWITLWITFKFFIFHFFNFSFFQFLIFFLYNKKKKIFQLFLNKVLTFGKQYVIINAENEKKGSSKNEKRKNLCDL